MPYIWGHLEIGVSIEITLISSTLHTSKLFSTHITTFDEILVQLEVAAEAHIQLMNNFEHVTTPSIIHVEETVSEPIKEMKTYVYI